MRGDTARPRRPGRPRSQEADAAILAAALDLLLERGADQTSIEQVAQRAGVTRATVYRRFAGKTTLLIQAIESRHADHDPAALHWPDVGRMLADWAGYLSGPGNRKMLRRLYSAADDYPELLQAYRDTHGHQRAAAVRATLEQARDRGELAPDTDLAALQHLLQGAVLHHLVTFPDTTPTEEIESYLAAVTRQAGHRPP
ncbi:TetR family transcriptional regulator [Sphaerisporangium rufum]|uniref:TetR family transcriptional regulator n=1 Tax=Sphaerisporangium rufum TaxID=1381558 RepID=A0A919UWT5_9ACTN|nr:TetR/AcrR family transcriptional regulator [Sphaerisporangium rufum]GII75164.1 TetR family transcriptional regulator [Sphaerisporangium rufum]